MARRLIIFAVSCLLCLPAFELQARDKVGIEPVVVQKDLPKAGYLQTALQSNHQGEHELIACQAVLDDGVLYINFPMNPAYHLQLSMLVEDGYYDAELDWRPIDGITVRNEVISMRLVLEKVNYAVGDLLYGWLAIEFSSTWKNGERDAYYVKGPFSAIVRPNGFDPQADENIATYTEPVALNELPMLDDGQLIEFKNDGTFSASRISAPPFADLGFHSYEDQMDAVRKVFFRDHPQPAGSEVRELTWDINPDAPFADGDERLTIWFKGTGEKARQLGYCKWTKQ